VTEHYLKRELYDLVQRDTRIFDFLQQGALDGLWYWDVTQPEQEWLSPRFKDLFGYEDHEVPNTSEWWQDNIHPDDLALALHNFQRHIDDPAHPYDQTVRYRHKDGSTVWVRCRGLGIRDDNGKVIRMLGCHQDVTALKHIEEQLRSTNAALGRSNVALTDFARVVSHDLKEPTRSIRGLAEILLEDHGAALDSDGVALVTRIVRQADRMQALIEGVLRYSRIGALQLGSVDLGAVVQRAIEALGEQIAERPTTIDVAADLPFVQGDGSLLGQVFQNLVQNALKYNESSTRLVSITAERADDVITVSVRDNGVGIASDDVERAVTMFRRLASSTKFGSGEGLGLAFARRVVEVHGHALEIKSTPPAGTTIQFQLSTSGAKRSSL
jgi:PAS domain S-box-containing protein